MAKFASSQIVKSCPPPKVGPNPLLQYIPYLVRLVIRGSLVGPVSDGLTRLNMNDPLQYLWPVEAKIDKIVFRIQCCCVSVQQ